MPITILVLLEEGYGRASRSKYARGPLPHRGDFPVEEHQLCTPQLAEILQRAPDYGCGGYTTEDAHRISWKLTAESLKAASRQGGQNDCPARLLRSDSAAV